MTARALRKPPRVAVKQIHDGELRESADGRDIRLFAATAGTVALAAFVLRDLFAGVRRSGESTGQREAAAYRDGGPLA